MQEAKASFFNERNKKMRIQKQVIDQQGLSSPLFLQKDTKKIRLFMDVNDSSMDLLYTYDPLESMKKKDEVEWFVYEGGRIESDFACLLYGPPSAVRFRVHRTCSPIQIEMHEIQL